MPSRARIVNHPKPQYCTFAQRAALWGVLMRPYRRMGVLPLDFFGPSQRDWNRWANLSWNPIQAWCRKNDHPGLANSLKILHDRIRQRTAYRVSKGLSARLDSKSLDALVHSTLLDRKGGESKSRMRRRHIGMLAKIGLVRKGRGWVEYVDPTEMPAAALETVTDIQIRRAKRRRRDRKRKLAAVRRGQERSRRLREASEKAEEQAGVGAPDQSVPDGTPPVAPAPSAPSVPLAPEAAAAPASTEKPFLTLCKGHQMPFKEKSMFGMAGPTINSRLPKNTPAMRQRAELEREWQAERQAYQERPRVPEAVCRGYHGQPPDESVDRDAPSVDPPFALGDERLATNAWLHQELSHVPAFAFIANGDPPTATRAIWRAAMAVMVARPCGTVKHASWYLDACVKRLETGRLRDPRGEPGYRASDTWPADLLRFALVRLPAKFR